MIRHEALQELLEVATTVSGATRAAICYHDYSTKKLQIITSKNFDFTELDEKYRNSQLSQKQPIVLLPAQDFAVAYKGHPLATLAPQIKSMAVYLIHADKRGRWSLSLANANPNFFQNDDQQVAVEHIRSVMEGLILAHDTPILGARTVDKTMEFHIGGGFAEQLAVPQIETSFRFLRETLIHRPRLLARGGMAYTALCAWRKSIKEYQIAALKAIKLGDLRHAADYIAGEMASAAQKFFGNQFNGVVPVPPGSSGRADGLSIQIAENLAKKLSIEYLPLLKAEPVSASSSHPRKSAALKPYRIDGPAKASVLLVDDVASSGRHLELAHQALTGAGASVHTLVWIAD